MRRGTKEVADEAVRTAVTKPLLDLSGNLSEYRQQVGHEAAGTLSRALQLRSAEGHTMVLSTLLVCFSQHKHTLVWQIKSQLLACI